MRCLVVDAREGDTSGELELAERNGSGAKNSGRPSQVYDGAFQTAVETGSGRIGRVELAMIVDNGVNDIGKVADNMLCCGRTRATGEVCAGRGNGDLRVGKDSRGNGVLRDAKSDGGKAGRYGGTQGRIGGEGEDES